MPQVAALTVKVDADIASATRGLDAIEQKVAGMGGRLGQLFSTAGGFLLARGVEAVMLMGGQLASAALDFEAQMANVNSIIKVSGSELQALSDQVLGLTSNPGITQGPADLAAGLYNIVSSGLEGAAALDTLEVSAMAATAGLTSTDIAAQVIVGTMNAYGQETYTAAQIADVLFKTVDSGVITFEELASNMGQVLAVGASLGVGVDQLGAAYAQMTLNAVPAAQAETQIAALMRSALQPTEALSQAVQKHGYASAEALIAAEGMPGYLRVLIEESDGSKEALLGLVGSTEAMNAATILGKDGVEEYNKLLFEMTGQLENGGALTEALEKQMLSANYALAKMKQQVTVAATVFMGLFAPGIRAGAEAFTGFLTGGVIPFTNVISQAVRGGFEFREVVDTLPQPLRRTAGAVGTIAEGIGDLVRAFEDRGLDGMLSTLIDGGEGEQILNGLKVLAEEGWGLFTGTLKTAASAGIDLLPVAVTGGIRLAGELGRVPGRALDWLKGKLFGVAGANGAGLTDGSSENVSFLPLQSEPITVGDVVIESGVRLVGGASNIAGRVKEWIAGQLFGAPGGTGLTDGVSESSPIIPTGFSYDIANVSFDILDAIINVSAEDVEGWIQGRIDEIETIKVHLDRWGIILGGSPSVESDGTWGLGGDTDPITAVNNWVQEQTDKINGEHGLVIDATNWLMKVTGNPDEADITNFDEWMTLIEDVVAGDVDLHLSDIDFSESARKIGGKLLGNFASNMKLLFVTTPLDIGGDFVSWIKGGLFGGQVQPAFAGQEFRDEILGDVNAGTFDGLFDEILADLNGGIEIFVADLTDSATEFKDDIKSAIEGAFDINWPEMPGFVSDIISTIGGWISAIEDKLFFWRETKDEFEREQNGGMTNEQVQNARINPTGGVNYGFGSNEGGGYSGTAYLDPFGNAQPGVSPLPESETVIPARLDLDTADAVKKMADLGFADGSKKTLDNQFKATFDLDTAKAEEKNTSALEWGQTWADGTFESEFTIDIGPAALKYTDAFLWGDTWAKQVFTARFSVDLSPLEAAKTRVAELAQEISDLLPHSPAKKGPLARPISFGYIADDLESTLDRMAGAAGRGMGRVGDAFSSNAVRPDMAGKETPRDGATLIFITPDSEQFSAIAQEARRGGDFARLFPQLMRES